MTTPKLLHYTIHTKRRLRCHCGDDEDNDNDDKDEDNHDSDDDEVNDDSRRQPMTAQNHPHRRRQRLPQRAVVVAHSRRGT